MNAGGARESGPGKTGWSVVVWETRGERGSCGERGRWKARSLGGLRGERELVRRMMMRGKGTYEESQRSSAGAAFGARA